MIPYPGMRDYQNLNVYIKLIILIDGKTQDAFIKALNGVEAQNPSNPQMLAQSSFLLFPEKNKKNWKSCIVNNYFWIHGWHASSTLDILSV